MNLQETLQLLDKLNAIGAKHFRNGTLEITLSGISPNPIPQPARVTVNNAPVTPEPAYNADNTQKVQELIDLLKMKDEQLVNTIFPAGA